MILFFMPIFLFGQSTTVKTITIEPYMSKENYEHFKRLVLESSDSKVNYINGFDFEWGYYYTLKVEENYLGQMSEGTNYEYSLIKIISKEKVNDTLVFQLFIDPLRYYQILEEDYVNNYTLNQQMIVLLFMWIMLRLDSSKIFTYFSEIIKLVF